VNNLTDQTVRIPARRGQAVLLCIFWAPVAGAALIFLLGGLWLLLSRPLAGAILATCGVILLPITTAMLAICLQCLRLDGPLIELSPDGLRDRRISEETLPWERLIWRAVATPRGPAPPQFWTDRPIAARWPYRLLAILNMVLRQPPYTVLPPATGKTAAELAALMSRFRAPSP
jgi:hypothetical protein